MGAQFLNADLEVLSNFDLLPLRQQLGDRVDLMFCGEVEPGVFLLSVELAGDISGPDHRAKALCKLIGELTGSAREAWAAAHDRVFDFGFDAVLDSPCTLPLLSPETLLKIGSLNARLTVTIYTNNLQGSE